MKANLPQMEQRLLASWRDRRLYQKLCEKGKDRPQFILHDGPPYANGHLHMGHALNKILKDIVCKSKRMMGFDAPYVPGWDCHGLPIEWKIEERFRAQKRDKDTVPLIDFRQECREFAQHWVTIQKEEFQRLGVLGDWDHAYLTMSHTAEAAIVGEIHKALMGGNLYKGLKPVQWSVVEKTALAEAEVEYQDKTSSSVYIAFPLVGSTKSTLSDKLKGASAVIWTTTPWTLPANRAISFNPDTSYSIVHIPEKAPLLIATDLVSRVKEAVGWDTVSVMATFPGTDLEGVIAAHPLRGQGYDFDVPLLPGDHVTLDQGTGLVHTAPSHGVDDFQIGLAHGLEVPSLLGEDGVYYDHVPLFAGLHVFKADAPVLNAIDTAGHLIHHTTLRHSYPHSWRSKAPLIYRATPQWFISMETHGLRKKALREIDRVTWYPTQGRNRLYSMIENRPDWCISRQRAWGVPIALFVSKKTGEPLRDPEVNQRIVAAFERHGADVWYTADPQEFLGSQHRAQDFEIVRDIVDVWFESGTTHSFVLKTNPALSWPADIYVEGTDQHRGWLQSSLLESCMTQDTTPYKAVLTHGFIVDKDGRKMSKSIGNTINLKDIIDQQGADILRLWVVGSDYFEDLKIGNDILKRQEDIYRKLRNTWRYLLGNLGSFSSTDRLAYDDLPELERWVLHRLYEVEQDFVEKLNRYDFHHAFGDLYNFCVTDLSAFYFDLRKDSLYCDARDSLNCRATLTVLDILFDALTKWLAPILSFTAEEAWQTRYPHDSVHEHDFPVLPKIWHNPSLGATWSQIRDIRRVVTGALEQERAQGNIGSSLQAHVILSITTPEHASLFDSKEIAEIMITSSGELRMEKSIKSRYTSEDVPHVGVDIALASGKKCERCWKITPDVSIISTDPVCKRCHEALKRTT